MTPPHTNLETQKKRHYGPLIGLVVVVLFSLGVILYWLVEEAYQAPSPQERAPQQQGTDPSAAPDGETAPAQNAAPTSGETKTTDPAAPAN